MKKTNFEYSEELLEKMSEMLKPDIISVMHNEVEKAISRNEIKERFCRDTMKKDIIMELWVLFLGNNSLVDEKTISNTTWSFVFNAFMGNVVMSVANMKTGTTFRYIVNSFDEDSMYETMDYMRLIFERNKENNKEKDTKNSNKNE